MSYQQPNQGYYAQPPPQGQYMQGPPPPQQVSRIILYKHMVHVLSLDCRCTTSKARRRHRRRRRRTAGVWLLVWRRCVVVGCAARRASAVWTALIAAAKQYGLKHSRPSMTATNHGGCGLGLQMIWRMHTLAQCFLDVHARDTHERVTAFNTKGKAIGRSSFGSGRLVV